MKIVIVSVQFSCEHCHPADAQNVHRIHRFLVMALFYYMLWRKKRNLDLILSIFLMGCVFMFFVPLVAAVAMVVMVVMVAVVAMVTVVAMVVMVAAVAMVIMVAAVAMVIMVAAIITTSVVMVAYLGKFVSLHNFALDSLGHSCFLGIFNIGVPLICSTWHTFGAPFRHNRTPLLKTCIIC